MSKVPQKVVKTYDVDVQHEYDGLHKRRRELQSRLTDVQREIEQTKINIGAMYSFGGKWQDLDQNLVQLEREVNAIECSLQYNDGRIAALKRSHSWIRG